ncbi:MAG: cyclic nucleotide-binding domain-containing protein [Myxococcales bacterium]|nr:cyclic nucleotide-binding domain-containing protein [Myxococcales bacterium]
MKPLLDVPAVLKTTELFRSFTDTGLQILASIAQVKTLPPGTPLFVQNMLGDSLYVVAEGRVRLSVKGRDGQDVTLAILAAPSTIGEAAILRSGPRLCSAVAEVDTTVVELARRDVAQLQKTKPQAVLKLMMSVVDLVSDRLRAVDDDLRQFLVWKAGL